MLELYNTTNDVKRIPKYKYNGKFVIPPHGSVKIEDEQAYFFKPYARVGIVVRREPVLQESKPDIENTVIEEPVENVVETVEEAVENIVEVPQNAETMEEISFDSSDEMEEIGSFSLETEPIVEQESEIVIEEIDEEPVEELKDEIVEELPKEPAYTEKELSEMGIKELREVAKELNIDIHGMRKKDVIRRTIIENL